MLNVFAGGWPRAGAAPRLGREVACWRSVDLATSCHRLPRAKRGVGMQAISIGWWRFAFTIVGGLCAGLTTLSAANAQSLDPQQPAALAPGVNKGNVDSFKGAHYYYFWAGPGHFDVNMAFREMGLFGAPHRQSLSFDFYDDDA